LEVLLEAEDNVSVLEIEWSDFKPSIKYESYIKYVKERVRVRQERLLHVLELKMRS